MHITINFVAPRTFYATHLSLVMADKFRKFANAAAAMAVSLSRPNYFESGKKGTEIITNWLA